MAGIPLHPQLVHFPIAFLTVSFLLDLIGILINSKKWIYFGGILLLLAVLTAFAALLSGQSAEDTIEPMSDAFHDAVEEHEGMATRTFFFILMIGIVRGWLQIKSKFNSWKQWGYIMLAGIGVMLILRVGHLGGKLVYNHGAGVSKELLKTAPKN